MFPVVRTLSSRLLASALLLSLLSTPAAAAPSAFEVDVTPRGPLPDPAIVGTNETLPLAVHVDGPAGLVPPDEVHLAGEDDAGANLTFSPNPVPLEPGRHRYPVNATYHPPDTGLADLTVHADGPLRAQGNWTGALPVREDPLTVDVSDVGEAAANWTVPVTVRGNTTQLPRDPVALALQVRSDATDPAVTWNTTPQEVTLETTPSEHQLAFPARYGAGTYEVQVHADGPRSSGRSAAFLVTVEEPSSADGTAPVEATVPDRPASLVLQDDSVNADGKAKYPGQEVITRVEARDPNGLGDASGVRFAVHRTPSGEDPVLVRNRTVDLPDDAWTRRGIPFEDRFGWAPLKDGEYTVTAHLLGTDADPVQRTFRVRDEQADLAGGDVADAVAATPLPPLQGTALVADDNLGGGPEGPPVPEFDILVATLYDHTVAINDPEAVALAGGNATLDLSNATSHPDEYGYGTDGDAGLFRVPFQVHLPDDAEPGSFHVSLDHRVDGTRRDLGALDFTLHPPPAVAGLEAGPVHPGHDLEVNGTLEGPEPDRIRLELHEADGDLLNRTNASALPASVPVPAGLAPGADLRLEATPVLADGRNGTGAQATLSVAPTPPHLRVGLAVDGAPHPHDPLRLRPNHAPRLNLTVDAQGLHHRPPNVTARLLDWTDSPRREAACADPEGPPRGLTCHLDLPDDLPVGRYTLQVRAQGPGGDATWNRTLEAGPWLDVAVPGDLDLTPGGDGTLEGRFPVRNDGNVPAHRLHVALGPLEGPEGATWNPTPAAVDLRGADARTEAQDGGVTVTAPSGPLLEADQDTRVDLAVPLEAGVPPGNYTGTVTVTTPLEAGR